MLSNLGLVNLQYEENIFLVSALFPINKIEIRQAVSQLSLNGG